MGKRSYKPSKKGIVVLRYRTNNCYVEVIGLEKSLREDHLQIDIRQGVWFWQGERYKIGESRPTKRDDNGVIGIYNRTSIRDLDAMVQAASEPNNEKAIY